MSIISMEHTNMLNKISFKPVAIALLVLSIPALATAQMSTQQGSGMQRGDSMPMQPGTQMQPGAQMQLGAQQQMGSGTPHMSRRPGRFTKLYDLDQNGEVTLKEINKDQGLIFKALDLDGDNALSVDEMKRRGRSLQLWQSVTMFDLMDVNGDQKLSLDEMTTPTGRWFKRYDANKNGVLEASELPNSSGRRGRSRGGRFHH
jgi:Ca2+-binding EF-hand superfamily protein